MEKELSESQKNIRRRKELAILKAQNEMLEQAKQGMLSSSKYDDNEKRKLADEISHAQKENIDQGMSLYGASEDDINAAKYSKPSKHYVDTYNERLKRKGITDEQLHVKDITDGNSNNVSVSYGEKTDDEHDAYDNGGHVDDDVIDIPYDNGSGEEKKGGDGNDAVSSASGKLRYIEDDSFDISGIPDYVQYDILPLPSNGQCYKSKKSRIPVAYLTASDENLITSPNLYRDGKILDLLLKRKVLDKSVNVDELCKGDRDAIILWLRATGYGFDFPIKVHDPELDTDYETSVSLDKIKTKPFDLVGDENGWFDYETSGGDKVKFKYLNRVDELELQKIVRSFAYDARKRKIAALSSDLLEEVKDDIFVTTSERERIMSAAKLISSWSDRIKGDEEYEGFGKQMTESMIMATMSVNGRTDRKYIRGYVENMRAREAYDYRGYMSRHEPGMDFNITVNRPESLGGGSFTTFLEFDSFVFLSIS